MAFTGARDTIRDSLLSFWSQEYTAAGERLLIAPGSDAYLWASALAVMLEGLEAQAESVARDILPDQASDEAIARHGSVDGVARRAGVRSRHTVTVTAGVDATYTFPTGVTYRMAYSDGTLYTVDSVAVTIAAGTGTITVAAAPTVSTSQAQIKVLLQDGCKCSVLFKVGQVNSHVGCERCFFGVHKHKTIPQPAKPDILLDG